MLAIKKTLFKMVKIRTKIKKMNENLIFNN